MPKNGRNGTKVMTYEEMQEVMSYLLQQDTKHEARFAKIEAIIEQNSREQKKREREADERYEKRGREADERDKKRVRESEERFDKLFKRAMAVNAQMNKILAERVEELQTAQLNGMKRTEILAKKIDVLVDAINKITLNRDRTGKNGNGHKRPSSKK